MLKQLLWVAILPALIFMYATTQVNAWLYLLTTVNVLVCLSMLVLSATAYFVTVEESKRLETREKWRKMRITRNVGHFLNLATTIALFVYVNNFNGVIYALSVLMLLWARATLLNGRKR